jgi:chemotaxis protein CheD
MNGVDGEAPMEWLRVRIGEIRTAICGGLSATLGSCVGIAILCDDPRIAGLAHCLLPEGESNARGAPARYVDSGIRNLLRAMHIETPPRRRLRTYIAGGASMFPQQTIREKHQVGRQNLAVCRRELRGLGIRFEELETGGSLGCELQLDFDRQTVGVRLLGEKTGKGEG